MVTGYIEINGVIHQIDGTFDDRDPNFNEILERTRCLLDDPPDTLAVFDTTKNGTRVELYVAPDRVVTAAAWLEPAPRQQFAVPKRIR
jgi:hypothetical protein